MTDLLFDTRAVTWTGNGDPIDADAKAAINTNHGESDQTYVSSFSAWELGLLDSGARLRLERPAASWFKDYVIKGRITLEGTTPRILIAASFLPGGLPADPADQIIIATTRTLNLCIVTRDRLILDYASAGHVRALRC